MTQNVNSFYASPIPLVNSISYKSNRSQHESHNYGSIHTSGQVSGYNSGRGSEDVDDRIQSVLCYGKFLDKENKEKQSNRIQIEEKTPLTVNNSVNNVMEKSESQKDVNNYIIKKIYAQNMNNSNQTLKIHH